MVRLPIELSSQQLDSEQENHLASPSTITLDEASEAQTQSSLPPVDRGKDAWLFLVASFFMEGLVWGAPRSLISQKGVLFFMFPVVVTILRMYPRQARWAPLVGLVVMCLTLTVSSFSQTVPHLIVTQGVIYALAGSVSYCPCMNWVGEWFVERRGFAYGVMWSGTGLGGCAIPLVLEFLLRKYGFRTTLRIWAVALFVLTMPVIYFGKRRLPVTSAVRPRLSSLRFIWNRTFLLYQTASIIQSLGFFLPFIYLPNYARTILGAKPFLEALTVILINGSAAIGTAVMGSLTDRLHATTCILICTIGTALGIFSLWGFATHLAVLYVFSIVYGLFAGSYVATWPGIVRQMLSDSLSGDHLSSGQAYDPTIIHGLLTAGRGIRNIISGPLSEVLIKGMATGRGTSAWDSGYSTMIAFTGSTALVGGITFLWRRIGWIG
ncbi:hypothetical protein NM208_g6917 [Fusarium decemcellulare]|uniref:Uncharacterized protein n=1 Tax=Fusarium decemcellulare TaxID=57161 RepID=A0ACC1SB63_9HYPO|nr:hypothetical protein NM208_g6917 [Fusarium decemcellulare]